MSDGGKNSWPMAVLTLGGAGKMPFAPGTFGTLAAAGLLVLLYRAIATHGPGVWNGVLLAGVVVWSLATIGWSGRAIELYGKKDPQAVVSDEAAGIFLTMLFLPMWPGWQELWVIGAGFFWFRFFDITKFFPARQLERLPGGWGILMDDLAAGIYANLVCQTIFRVVITSSKAVGF
jgi:phosphatidylglycerophosphatase A